MGNFSKGANQLWKESNTSLSFKDWLEREKNKGRFIPNKKFLGADGIDTSKSDNVIEEANVKILDTLDINSNKFERVLGIDKKNTAIRDKNKFIGLNKWLLISSLALIGGTIVYKVYNKNK